MTEDEKRINVLFSEALEKARLAEKLWDDAYNPENNASHAARKEAASRLTEAKDRVYEVVMTYGAYMTYKVPPRDLTGWA